MRAPIRWMTFAALLGATVALANDPFDYKAVAANAEKLVAEKQFDAAEQTIVSSILRCNGLPPANQCVAYLNFTLGYVLAGRGDAASLPRAEAAYGEAAKVFSDNAQLRANLAAVLLREGKMDAAARAFERAATLDPQNTASRYLAAAEAFRLAGAEWQALPLYQKAIDAGSADASSGLVSMMAGWIEHSASPAERDSRIRQTFDIAHDLRGRGALGAAVEGYETVMTYHAQTPAVASEALAAWTEARASARTLSPSALERLPSDWSSPFLKGLTDTLNRGEWAFAPGSRTSDLERYASAAAARVIADGLLVRGKQVQALDLYKKAMDESPDPRRQDSIPELKSLPVVFLDAAVQIARVASKTGDQAKFANVEQRLFDEKMQAYQSNNLAAVQRMHTVLGSIYAERGTWASPGPFTNATFQLTAALSAAKQRENNEGILQPLPYLHETLAKGYRIQNRPSLASEEDLAAARDYLDLDALAPARVALNRAKASAPTATTILSHETRALESILDYRDSVPTLDWKKDFSLPKWTDSPATPILDSGFLARQQFKTLADLSGLAKRKGDSEAAEAFSYGAFEAVNGQKTYGTADSLRLIDIRTVGPKPAQPVIEPERWKYLLEPVDPKLFQTVPREKNPKYREPSSWMKTFEVPASTPGKSFKGETIKSSSSDTVKATTNTKAATDDSKNDPKKKVKAKLTTEGAKKDEEKKPPETPP